MGRVVAQCLDSSGQFGSVDCGQIAETNGSPILNCPTTIFFEGSITGPTDLTAPGEILKGMNDTFFEQRDSLMEIKQNCLHEV